MDLGSVYMNKNKHSSDVEIASLHKALHDLQSYIHLILRIIGGLAGFTSDHLSAELINELSKISHDSTVQVLFPYKSSSTRTMTNVPQTYYMDSNDGDYSTQFNVGVNDSPWSGVQYSTFFSNLAKSLPASSATDFRESHQLGLNQVVRPNPRKPPISLFATYNPSRNQVKHIQSTETKTHAKSINQPINVKMYQNEFKNRNDHDKFNVSSENRSDYEALISRNVPLAESKATIQAMGTLDTVEEKETDVLSKECSGTIRLAMNSVSVQNQGYLDPSNTTSVNEGKFIKSNCTAERAKKLLSSETNSGSDQTKSLTCTQESLNRSTDLVLPECRAGIAQPRLPSLADYASEPIDTFSKEDLDIKTVNEHIQSPNITKLLKTAAFNEKDVSNASQVKLVESNHDPSTLTITPHESFVGQQEKNAFNVTEQSKISLVDITLLQDNVSNVQLDQTLFSRTNKEIDEEKCLIFSKKLNSGSDNLHVIPLANITGQPLTPVIKKDNKGRCAAVKNQVDMGECNSGSDPAALIKTTPKSVSCENVDKDPSLPQVIGIEQSKPLLTKQQMDQIKEDDSAKPMASMPVSVSDPPKCPIGSEEPSSVEKYNVNVPSSNIIGSSLTSSIEIIKEGKGTIVVPQVTSGGCNNENDPAAFLNTALNSSSCESGIKDLSLTPNAIELSNPSVSRKTVDQRMEEDSSDKPKVKMCSKCPPNASDHDLISKIDRRIEVANLSARGWPNTRGCLNKQHPELDNLINTQKNLSSKTAHETPGKFDLSSSNPNIVHENLQETCIKYNFASGANLEEMLPALPALHLKMPDMPDLVNDSDSLSLQSSLSELNEDLMDWMTMKFASKVIKNTRPLQSQSPEFLSLDSATANKSKDPIPSNNTHEEVDVNKPFDLGIEGEARNKITSEKIREKVMEYVDTSDTNELSDDDSEGKLVIDIPDTEFTLKPSADSVSTRGRFSHPKKNWRIKMLQDTNQIDSHRNITIDALKQSKTPRSIIGQDSLHLSQNSFSNLSADSSYNQILNKTTFKTAPLLIGSPGEQSGEVRFPPGKQIGSTFMSSGDKSAFKNMSSDISSNNATELFHHRLKHLPEEIQRGLRKRNEILMKYFSSVYPKSQLQSKLSVDSFYRTNDPDSRLSTVGTSLVSHIFDSSARVVDEETENEMLLEHKIKHSAQGKGALDPTGAYVRSNVNKTMGSAAYSPEFELQLKLTENNDEDRTIDSDNSFLSYILRGYNTSGEEGSSQSASDLRKINNSYLFPLGNIGQYSLTRITGENVKDQDYTPKEKRRKTNADLNIDTDHRRRREKNNEASKRHRESKKKLQKEAFDNITQLEEINLRLRKKAEKLDSAVKQVLKVITTLSTNS